jgi:hypothetical protein
VCVVRPAGFSIGENDPTAAEGKLRVKGHRPLLRQKGNRPSMFYYRY